VAGVEEVDPSCGARVCVRIPDNLCEGVKIFALPLSVSEVIRGICPEFQEVKPLLVICL
jgi:hypothetical protein